MGIKISGAFGRELAIDYAMSAAFIPLDYRNRAKVACKICAVSLEKGTGLKHLLADPDGMNRGEAYLCEACAHWLMEFRLRYYLARGTPLPEPVTVQETG